MTERKPNRLKGYDYATPGAYFVTVCVHARFENRNIFGEIRHDDIIKNRWADIIELCWRELPTHYPHISLDEFIVMPDHIHGIVWINNPVGNGFKPFPTISGTENAVGNGFQPFRQRNYGLPEIMRGLKTFSARRINESNHDERFQWQKSYYDHVVRDEESLAGIREYIRNNPAKWELDHDRNEGNDITRHIKKGTV